MAIIDRIEVEMAVSRVEVHEAEGVVCVWGHVGDYEVMTAIPWREAEEKGLVPVAKAKKSRPGDDLRSVR